MDKTDFLTLTGLVQQYSPSGQERAAVDWLVARMAALGFSQSFRDEAGNAVGVMGNGPRQIVLLGHIDTVPGQISVRVEGDLLYGRGSVDAKGPLACFTDAVAQVGPVDGWQFVVIGAVEEERNSEGAQYVTSAYRPQFAIIGEPNRWDRVSLGYKGSAWLISPSTGRWRIQRDDRKAPAKRRWQSGKRCRAGPKLSTRGGKKSSINCC